MSRTKPAARPTVVEFRDGICIHGSFGSPEVGRILQRFEGRLPLIIGDPPYGGIVPNDWDQGITSSDYLSWTRACQQYMAPGGSLYLWGGIGKPGNRVFFKWLATVEEETGLTLRNLITWSKRRAYGTKTNYLFTREECAWLVNGVEPAVFHIPLLARERGYAGYNAKYPAKSRFLRRTSVWSDITELFRGKVHVAQKPERLAEVMIETHTDEGDTVMDPFAGSGSTGRAARNLGRRFILIERDQRDFELCVGRL